MSTPKSGKFVPLVLDTMDIGQALDALDTRAEAYERTAEYLEAEEEGEGYDFGDDFFVIEEVSDSDEARAIANHFRHIQSVLQKQWDEWEEQQPK
jgi:hypothetical protein